MLRVYSLKTENLVCPLGLDADTPRLSWKLESDRKNVIQTSYRIIASSDENCENILWDSNVIASDKSHSIRWGGKKLLSRQRIYWKVIVQAGKDAAESEITWFEMGLLDETDWKGKWIEPEDEVNIFAENPAPYLRKEFRVKEGLVKARIYQSSHGLYEFWINGNKGTLDVFKPGFTVYYQRTQYQVYDITDLLQEGINCWAVILGDGWWRGCTGGSNKNNFGYKVAYIGQIELQYANGIREIIGTDESFVTSTGGLLVADMLVGEVYDARLEPEDWKLPGFDASLWKNVHFEKEAFSRVDTLISSRSVPVREMEHFIPEVLYTPDGGTVLNFKQNIAGYMSMVLHDCKAGQKITVLLGETLDENGNFTQKNFSGAGGASIGISMKNETQKIEYIMKGDECEKYHPMFAISGFQYARIDGYEKEIKPEDFQAIAVYSALEETGKFICSNKLINKLVENSRWSQKGNFMDVPTDCPQRERSPWTGDAQVYARTASDFMNVYPFFEKWLQDLSLEQKANGKVPNTAPSTSGMMHYPIENQRVIEEVMAINDEQIRQMRLMMLGTEADGCLLDGSSGWGDAAVIVPYIMYLCYGDEQILKNQFESAKRWVDYVRREAEKENPVYKDLDYYKNPEDAKYVWDTDFHWGEWLESDSEGFGNIGATFMKLITYPEYISATLFYFYSAKLLSEMADIVGASTEALEYREVANNVKRVFNKYFIHDDGMIQEGRQAPNVRALAFEIVNEENRSKVAGYLNKVVEDCGYKLNTGFLSTPFILHALVNNGYVETAFRLLEQTESPSWLKPVIDGATTIMERWNAFEECDASFNHYSYGAVCDFLFSRVGGIQPLIEKPGYKEFIIQPIIGGTLTEAITSYDSVYGKIESAWKKENKKIVYQFTVPVNTMATVILPAKECKLQKLAMEYKDIAYNNGMLHFKVGSGNWKIEIGD